MAQIHDRTTTVLARPGVIRITLDDEKIELTAEAAEKLAQDIQRALAGLGQNPVAP